MNSKNRFHSKILIRWRIWCTANRSKTTLKSHSSIIKKCKKGKELHKNLMKNIHRSRWALILLISSKVFTAFNSPNSRTRSNNSREEALTTNRNRLPTRFPNSNSINSLVSNNSSSSRRTISIGSSILLVMILLINRIHCPETSSTTLSRTTQRPKATTSAISPPRTKPLSTIPSNTFPRMKWWTKLSICPKTLVSASSINSNSNSLCIKKTSHHLAFRRNNVATSLNSNSGSTSMLLSSSSNVDILCKNSNGITSLFRRNNRNLRILRLSSNGTSVSVKNSTVLGWSSALTMLKD